VLAVAKFRMPAPIQLGASPVLVLDDIRDPGNFGTLIRSADWFGFTHVLASENSVDFYNPKVISATMGSFCHVQVHYQDLVSTLKNYSGRIAGAFLDGVQPDSYDFGQNPVIVIGNESTGISADVSRIVTDRVTIPGFGQAESLNAAVAAGILMYASTRK